MYMGYALESPSRNDEILRLGEKCANMSVCGGVTGLLYQELADLERRFIFLESLGF